MKRWQFSILIFELALLAVILVLVIGTVRLIGGNANNVFSNVASSIPQ